MQVNVKIYCLHIPSLLKCGSTLLSKKNFISYSCSDTVATVKLSAHLQTVIAALQTENSKRKEEMGNDSKIVLHANFDMFMSKCFQWSSLDGVRKEQK